MYSLILDFFQLSSILFIFFTGPLIARNDVLIFFQALSIVSILWAAWEMKQTRYYRIPDTGKQNELVMTGIYKYIRNPMYFAELLFSGILVLNFYNPIRLIVFIILLVDLLLKIRYEEELLKMFFKEKFAEYKKTSWRLLPFIF